VNVDAGAKSQISALVSVGVISVTLLFLTPLFHHLPKAILAAIIVVAVVGLVDVRGARALWRVDRRDFTLMLATFIATLVLGIEEGILIGAGLSVAVVLQQITRPPISLLGRIPNTDRYRSVERWPDAIVEPGVAVIRMDASLFYGNAEAFRDAVRRRYSDAAAQVSPAALVIDAYPINRTDSTGLHVLQDLVLEIRGHGGRVYLCGVKEALDESLVAGGIVDLIGPEHLFHEIRPAVDAAAEWVARGREEATGAPEPATS
jgi:SulP family sulfate permease